MSIKLSYSLADFFVSKGWINKEEKIAYVVGLDVIFSTAAHWIIIIILGIARDRPVEAVVYLLYFATVRRYCGGYHASTRMGCFMIFIFLYLLADEISVMACGGLDIVWLAGYGICSLVMAVIVFWMYAPIKNERKRCSEEWLAGARKKSFVSLGAWYALAAGIMFIDSKVSGQIFSASNMVVLLMLMKKWGKKE